MSTPRRGPLWRPSSTGKPFWGQSSEPGWEEILRPIRLIGIADFGFRLPNRRGVRNNRGVLVSYLSETG